MAKIDKLFTTPEEETLTQLWDDLATPSESSFKIQVHRQFPAMHKGMKTIGYLKTFYLPVTIPDIMEQVAIEHGGGKYQLRIVDEAGKIIKSKTFEVVGFPKIPQDLPSIGQNSIDSTPPKQSELESIPIPTKEEMRLFLIRRSLLLLDQPGADQLETLKFLKELYRTVK